MFEIQKKTVTVTKAKNQTLDGSLSIKLNLGNGTSGSSGSKKQSGDKSGEAGVSFTRRVLFLNDIVFNIFEIQKKTVTVTKAKNQTIDGSLSIKLKSGNGTTGSSSTKKPSGSKPTGNDSGATGVSFMK